MACEDHLLDRGLLHESLFGYMSEEEEEGGLAIPPMEDETFLSSMMDKDVNADLANFFDKKDVIDEQTKPKVYSSATGRGKQLKLLKEVLKPNDYEEEKKIMSAKFDKQDKFWAEKIEISKRKLQDGYKKIADEKKQKQIQIVEFQHQTKHGSTCDTKKNRGETVKSRIQSRFRQLKKFHTTQRPKMTVAAF